MAERSGSRSAAAVDGAARGPRAIWVALLAAAFWATHLRFPNPPASPSLDTSWEQAVAQALVRGLQWGSDIEFTFGPLGAFGRPRYDPELFWTHLVVWELVVKGIVAVFAALAVLRTRGPVARALVLAAVLALLAAPDPYYAFAILAVAAHLLHGIGGPPWRAAPGLAVLAAIALVKFTYFTLVVAVVAILAIAAWRARSTIAGSRARSAVAAGTGVAALFLALLCAAWILCGQSPANLPAYTASSLTIASGYNEAMSLFGPPSEVWLALAVLLVGSGAALLHALGERRIESVALGAALVAGLVVAGKAGFVRHHRSNPAIFFALGATAPLLLLSAGGPAPGAGRTAIAWKSGVWICAVLSTCGYVATQDDGVHDPRRLASDWGARIAENLARLSSPRAFEAELARRRATLQAELDLPRIRERVGGEPVDLIHSRQDILFLNGLLWRPRPAFQGYFAYAPELLEDNARFLAGPRAPRYLVLAHETIDHRLPNMDDCEALLVAMRDYEPVLVERNCLLLERRADAPLPALAREPMLEREIAWNEAVAVPPFDGAPCLLALDIRTTAWGRVMSALYKSPSVWIECTTAGGEHERLRIVPAMMRSGVVIAPDLSTQDDWIEWFSGRAEGGLRDFRVVAGEGARGCFEPAIGVELIRLGGLPQQVPRRHWGRRRRRPRAPLARAA